MIFLINRFSSLDAVQSEKIKTWNNQFKIRSEPQKLNFC